VTDYFIVFNDGIKTRCRLFIHLACRKSVLQAWQAFTLRVIPYYKTSLFRFPGQAFYDAVIRFSDELTRCPGRRIRLNLFEGVRSESRLVQVDFAGLLRADHHSTMQAARMAVNQFFCDPQYTKLTFGADFMMFAISPGQVQKELRHSPRVLQALQQFGRGADRAFRRYAKELINQRSRFHSRLLEWGLDAVLKRLFRDIVIENIPNLGELDQKYQIVYLPTHRSHLDFLILPYSLYMRKINSPLVAAGDHLLHGPLKYSNKISAYFIRRKRMDGLYNAILFAYLCQHQRYGYSQMVFIEGTRSKTGYTMEPKSGMLSQYIGAYVAEQRKPVVFLPVNITYDYVVEGDSFLEEIIKHKKAHNIWDERVEQGYQRFRQQQRRLSGVDKIKAFWNEVTHLGQRGQAYLTFGRPLFLDNYLARFEPDWKTLSTVHKDGMPPEWIRSIGKRMALDACCELNFVTPITINGIVSVALISSRKMAMPYPDLEAFIALSLELFKLMDLNLSHVSQRSLENFSDFTYINRNRRKSDRRGSSAAGATPQREQRARKERRISQQVFLSEMDSLRAALIKNNIAHYYVPAAVVAQILTTSETWNRSEIVRQVQEIFPHLKQKYHLIWDERQIEFFTHIVLDLFVRHPCIGLRESDQVIIAVPVGEGCCDLLGVFAGILPVQQRPQRDVPSQQAS
jgi:glycerol-3-phosphate O-acyltransferase